MTGAESEDVGYLRKLYYEAIQGMRTELRDYWLNHAFLHGYQWLYWSEDAGRLDERPTDPERIQATVTNPDTGDSVTYTLYETGVNTGEELSGLNTSPGTEA